MLDFFARQQQARLNTAKVLPYLLLSIISTIALLYALCVGTCAVVLPVWQFFTDSLAAINGSDFEIRFIQRFWIPELFYAVSALTVLFIVGASIRKFFQLRHGGWFVAIELGGTRVDPQT